MILDYEDNQVILTEQTNESFMSMQDICKFNLCSRFRDKKYHVPFIALPIVIDALKLLEYKIVYTPALRLHYSAFNAERKELERCKIGKSILNEVRQIKRFITSQEVLISKTIPDFKFYDAQVDTIIYGIIGKRIIIGNDIGTGKTLIAITICRYLFKYSDVDGKALIMLPASLATNFVADYDKFYKDKKMMLIGSVSAIKRTKLWCDFKVSRTKNFLVTNYEKCRTDFDEMSKFQFDIVIVDEFHKMKNFLGAKMSINFFKLIDIWQPEYRIPVSGSMIENRMHDLYPVFKLLDEGVMLGGNNFFEKNFVTYEEKKYYIKTRNGHFLKTEMVAVGFKNHTFLKKLIRPFIIRKKLHLPVKLYQSNVMLDCTPAIKKGIDNIIFESETAMSAYVGIRQFLCDTEREGMKTNPKIDYLKNLLEQTSDKVIVFSFFKCSIRAITAFLKENGIKHISCQGGDGVDALDVVKQFNNDPDMKVLVTTDKINYGHNIQSAKWVIEWDKPVKPTTSMQRAGRAYRSGQTEDVHMVSLIIRDTLEEIIMEKTEAKKELIEAIIEGIVNESDKPESVSDIDKKIKNEIFQSFKNKYY